MSQYTDPTSRWLTPETGTVTYRRVTGPWLNMMRGLWIVAFLLMFGLTIGGASPRYNQLIQLAGQFKEALFDASNVTPTTYAGYMIGVAGLLLAIYTIVGIAIYWRKQDDWVALLVSLMSLSIATSASDFPDALALLSPHLVILVDLVRSLSQGLPIIVLFVFPGGTAQPPWTRWLALFCMIWTLLRPFLYNTPLHPNAWPGMVVAIWFLAWLGGGVAAQIYRYKRIAGPAQKQQTKWVVFGGIVGSAVFIATLVVQAAVPAVKEVDTLSWLLWKPVEYSAFVLAMLPFPVALAVSISRYRLWDIDFLINRSLVYGALTVFLFVLFVGSLFSIPMLFQHISGGGQSALAVGASAMAFGMMFVPTRRALQRFVDRRFFGIQINYQQAEEKRARSIPLGAVSGRTHFGDYTGLEPIGRGGMAEVYKARHPTLNRTVAIKVLPAMMAKDPSFQHRFEREAHAIATLRHPNIVQLFDFNEAEGTYYMVMEYISGPSLAEYMHEVGPLPILEVRDLLTDIASALDYAHQMGIVHRDVKPSNILLQPSTSPGGPKQRPVLTDFGIAKIVGGATVLTASNIVGTFDFIAPEQIRDSAEVDARTDVYALGVMAYQMLTGKLPFMASNTAALLIAHLQQPAPDPSTLRPDLPESISRVILKALEKEPDNRFNSAGMMVEALLNG
ncbi:MAG: protein kinase [Anaerolineae bacterium]|nr:protein kinase [Anaerolineae bacterium]